MSHKGTVPVFSNCSALENCIKATEKCDLFLSLITTRYGSGKEDDGISFTHQELLKAIELNKPRWLLSHDHVVFARSLLINLGYKGKDGRKKLALKKSNPVIENLRVIDMYEDAILSKIPLGERGVIGSRSSAPLTTLPCLPLPSSHAIRKSKNL